MSSASVRSDRLAALRAEVRALESVGAARGGEVLPFGLESVDLRLAGGGLAAAALHEAAGESFLLRLGHGNDAAYSGDRDRLTIEADHVLQDADVADRLAVRVQEEVKVFRPPA